MKMKYKVVSRAQNEVAAVGTSLGVFYDYRNRQRVDFTKDIIERIETIEGRSIPRTQVKSL